MNKELLKLLPIETLKSLPANDPAALKAALKQLPLETLRGIADQTQPERPDLKDQTKGAVRSGLATLTAGISEPVVAAMDALAIPTKEEREKYPTNSFSDFIGNIKRKYDESISRGETLQEKVPLSETTGTAVRSALSPITFGASEPVISAAKAGYETLTQDGSKSFGENFDADVAQRNEMRKKYPVIDTGSQVAGMLVNPEQMVMNKVGGAMAKAAVSKGYMSAEQAVRLFSGPTKAATGFVGKALQEGEAIVRSGAKLATDVGIQSAGRNLTLKPAGFVGEEEPSVGEAMKSGFKFGAGLRGAGTAAKVLGGAGSYGLGILTGAKKKDIDYYLANFDRLKGKEADIGKVHDDIMDSVQRIRDDFNARVLDETEAKKVVSALEDQLKSVHVDRRVELRNEFAEVKKALDLEFAESKANMKNFQRYIPQAMYKQVEESVGEAKKAVVDAHIEKLDILKKSPQKVNLDGLDSVIDEALGELNVVSKKQGAFGKEAQAAQGKLEDYREFLLRLKKSATGEELKTVVEHTGKGAKIHVVPKGAPASAPRLGSFKSMDEAKAFMAEHAEKTKGIPASEAWKLVKQADNDVAYFSSLTHFKDTADATLSRFRGELQDRIKQAVPGYAEAVEKNMEAGRFLDKLTTHFDKPEQIFASLQNIGAPEKYLVREALLELGERRGKNFMPLIEEAQKATEVAMSPKALQAMKDELPQNVNLKAIQDELEFYKNPSRVRESIQGAVEQSPEFAQLQKVKDARNQAEQLDEIFSGFTDLSIENKVKAVINGKEALRRRLQSLSTLSDKDFVQAVEDLGVLANFNKTAIQGSRRVNMFAVMGYSAASNADPLKRGGIVGLAALAASFLDVYGPKIARKTLDAVGNIKGMVTADKIAALPLPEHLKNDLVHQFGRALYYREDGNLRPQVSLTPEQASLVKNEISLSKSLTKAEKARNISAINKTGEVPDLNKLLMGNRPIPQGEDDPSEAPTQVAPDIKSVSSRSKSLQRRLTGGQQ